MNRFIISLGVTALVMLTVSVGYLTLRQLFKSVDFLKKLFVALNKKS